MSKTPKTYFASRSIPLLRRIHCVSPRSSVDALSQKKWMSRSRKHEEERENFGNPL